MMYFELLKRFSMGETLPLLHPIEDMEIEDRDLEKLIKARDDIDQQLNSSKL